MHAVNRKAVFPSDFLTEFLEIFDYLRLDSPVMNKEINYHFAIKDSGQPSGPAPQGPICRGSVCNHVS